MDTCPAGLTIGFPRESGTERRTILTPPLARALISAGFGVCAEPGIGSGVFIGNEEYAAAGVCFSEAARVWSMPLVLRYKSPDPGDLRHLRPWQHIAALFHAEGDIGLLTALQDCGATAWSYEFVFEGGRFPLGRPGGRIAGVQAVLAGAHALQTPAGRGVLLAAVDGAEKANVVVIGSGNVGAAAAETAAVLGANVTVLARREASRGRYLRRAPGGVRVVVNSRDTLLTCLAEADLVIGAILVSTYDTPPMISEADLAVMRPGAVIVDATCGYGPARIADLGDTAASCALLPPRRRAAAPGAGSPPRRRGRGAQLAELLVTQGELHPPGPPVWLARSTGRNLGGHISRDPSRTHPNWVEEELLTWPFAVGGRSPAGSHQGPAGSAVSPQAGRHRSRGRPCAGRVRPAGVCVRGLRR